MFLLKSYRCFNLRKSVLICVPFGFLQVLHVLHGKIGFSVYIQLRALRTFRGKNAFVQPQIFTDRHRSIKRAIKTNNDLGFLQVLHGKKGFSVYIQLRDLRALRGKNAFLFEFLNANSRLHKTYSGSGEHDLLGYAAPISREFHLRRGPLADEPL